MNWTEAFDMGVYGFHVWTCWGISLGTMIAIVILAKHRNAKIKTELARQIKREEKLKAQ